MNALDWVCLTLGYLSLAFLTAFALAVCVAGCVDAWRQWRAERTRRGERSWVQHCATSLGVSEPDPIDVEFEALIRNIGGQR